MVLSSTPFTTRLQPEFTSPFESTIQPEICNTGTPQMGLSGRASPSFAQGVEERGPARLQARLPGDPPGRPAGTAPKSEVPSFLLLQQLLKIMRWKHPQVGSVEVEKTVQRSGNDPSECHPKVCKTCGPMQPCSHPGPCPAARDARHAPVGTLQGTDDSHTALTTRRRHRRGAHRHTQRQAPPLRGGCQPGANGKSQRVPGLLPPKHVT